MRPDQCGTNALPPDGTTDREVVDQFADLLAHMAGLDRCAECGAPAVLNVESVETAPGIFTGYVTSRSCSADPAHRGAASGCICGPSSTGEDPDERPDCPAHGENVPGSSGAVDPF